MSNPTIVTAQPGVPFVEMVREFDAPVASVIRAYTDPALLIQWLGPYRLEMEIKEYDVRPGGSWHYVHSDQEGNAYEFRGVFHSVTDDTIVQTFEFAGAPGHVSLDSVTFEDAGDGRTRVSSHSVFQSVEARDGMVESGMESGITQGYERLDTVLAGL
ncbi:MAG: polyketide cyclase [Microbacteriaceae bacterium]|nr:polyketide cyclase [Microbacteriaceae bacterium]